jgi:hypothetical protein
MTIQEWAREAREWMEMYFRTGGFNLTTMKRLLSTYPEGESGKSSDRPLLEEAVILIRQYHDMMPTPESIEFLARAAELDKEGR